jgi:hypothetical protein
MDMRELALDHERLARRRARKLIGSRSTMFNRRELDHLVLDVEFVLISVVQGVALVTLAVEATRMLRMHDLHAYVFVASGLLIVLVFWSAALIHAISFVTWPMDLIHYFAYFGLGLLECLTFAQMERPRDWFGYSTVAFVVSFALYAYDYSLMTRHRPAYQGTEPLRRLYGHIIARQKVEMWAIVPAGIAFNLVAFAIVGNRPNTAATFATLQFLFMFGFLVSLVRSFTVRQRLITSCVVEPPAEEL